jgi:hypothetical protein
MFLLMELGCTCSLEISSLIISVVPAICFKRNQVINNALISTINMLRPFHQFTHYLIFLDAINMGCPVVGEVADSGAVFAF